MYHITVYAAMMLYRDAQTWTQGAAAVKALANLKQAMKALNAPELVDLEIIYNHQVVAEMRAELRLPRPSPKAKDSDQPASTGSEPTGSVATVSDPAVSAGLATQVSAPAEVTEVSLAAEVPAMKKPAAAHGNKRRAAAKPKQVKKSRVSMEVVAAATGEGLREFLAQARGTGSAGEVEVATEMCATATDEPELDETDLFHGFNTSPAEEREETGARKDADADEELNDEEVMREAARPEEEAVRPSSAILPG